MVRSNGEPTYLAADIAYLQDKRERGFERQLLPVGADHHGYVRELKAAMAALGGDPDTVEMPILQFVHLVEGDERAAMSKRRGDFVTLDDLLDEIGVDATRFFMLQRSHDRTRRSRPRPRAPRSRPRTPSTTSSTRTPGSCRCSRAAAEARVAEALGAERGLGRGRAARPPSAA